MVEQEAFAFINDLIIAFPQVDEVAKFNSPDLATTHRVWAKVLSNYTVEECRAVLDDWITGRLPPPSHADCKLIAHAIRAIVQRKRDTVGARENSERIRAAGRRTGTMQGERVAFSAIKGSMREAFETLKPIHKKMLDGEITAEDYERIKDNVLSELD